ncbi:MAG TPA: hypothetical protein VG756_15590 [Pseudonocardiaceae bacterium]|nr:hypothetical protein [Pseudonocardiaceae bacterium]
MSENLLALGGGVLAAVLLLVLGVRTVLMERRAGDGPRAAVPRPGLVVALDWTGVVLVLALLVALAGRMAVALGR